MSQPTEEQMEEWFKPAWEDINIILCKLNDETNCGNAYLIYLLKKMNASLEVTKTIMDREGIDKYHLLRKFKHSRFPYRSLFSFEIADNKKQSFELLVKELEKEKFLKLKNLGRITQSKVIDLNNIFYNPLQSNLKGTFF